MQQTVGDHVYTSTDGVVWVLQGKSIGDRQHTWTKEGEYYVNGLGLRMKQLPTPNPSMSAAPAAQTSQLGRKKFPRTVQIDAPTKTDAEGVYSMGSDQWMGLPVWFSKAGGVLYCSSSGYWIIGTKESMLINEGWVMSTEPHNGRSPNTVISWSSFSDADWIVDPCITIRSLDGHPSSSKVSGNSTYHLDGGHWILEGCTLQDQENVWKLKHSDEGTQYYVNPWTRKRVSELPDVANASLQSMGSNVGDLSISAFSARSRGKSQLETELESEIEQQKRTIQSLEEKEKLFLNRNSHHTHDVINNAIEDKLISEQMTGGPSEESIQRQLHTIETKLLNERQRLESQAKTASHDISKAIEKGHQLDHAAGVSAIQKMQDSLDKQYQQQELLKQRAFELEKQHEAETLKIQNAARELHRRNADGDRIAKSLQEKEMELQMRERRVAEHEQNIKKSDLSSEKAKLQEEVNNFYAQTSTALANAKRDVQHNVAGSLSPVPPVSAPAAPPYESKQPLQHQSHPAYAQVPIPYQQPAVFIDTQSEKEELIRALNEQKSVMAQELTKFATMREDTQIELETQKKQLEEDYSNKATEREARVSEIRDSIQAEMMTQLQGLKAEFYETLKSTTNEALAAKEEVGVLEIEIKTCNDTITFLEQQLADLRVEHEHEKSAIMRRANEDNLRMREQVDVIRATSVPQNNIFQQQLNQQEAENTALVQKNEELRKEVVRLRMEISDISDQQNLQMQEHDDLYRREATRLKEELSQVRRIIKDEHQNEINEITKQQEAQREEAEQQHTSEADRLQKDLKVLRDEMDKTKRSHRSEVDQLQASAKQEAADLAADLRNAQTEIKSLAESVEIARKLHNEARVAVSTEMVANRNVEAALGQELDRVRSQPMISREDTRQNLTKILDDELKKLNTEFVEPDSETHSRLKRFRDRSHSRSVSADPTAGLPIYRAPSKVMSHRRSISPSNFSASPSPFVPSVAQRTLSPQVTRQDELKRLQFLKDQMRHRLAFEQANT